MNSTEQKTQVTIECDDAVWTWPVRGAAFVVPVPDNRSAQSMRIGRELLSTAMQRREVVHVDGAPMLVSTMSPVEYGGGCAEFTVTWRKWEDPRAQQAEAAGMLRAAMVASATQRRGSIEWVRWVAGEGATVQLDDRASAYRVVLPAGTSAARVAEVHDTLRRDGPLVVHFEVEVAAAESEADAFASSAAGRALDRVGGVRMSDQEPKACVCGAPPTLHEHGPIRVSWTHRDDCPWVLALAREERRAREAPLVALVAAVPEGLDARGWTAAVLAEFETSRLPGGLSVETLRAAVMGSETAALDFPLARQAYLRAVAPQGPRPKPERKGATWRERGPRLVVDHGEE